MKGSIGRPARIAAFMHPSAAAPLDTSHISHYYQKNGVKYSNMSIRRKIYGFN